MFPLFADAASESSRVIQGSSQSFFAGGNRELKKAGLLMHEVCPILRPEARGKPVSLVWLGWRAKALSDAWRPPFPESSAHGGEIVVGEGSPIDRRKLDSRPDRPFSTAAYPD
jgi:hypothetical protein